LVQTTVAFPPKRPAPAPVSGLRPVEEAGPLRKNSDGTQSNGDNVLMRASMASEIDEENS